MRPRPTWIAERRVLLVRPDGRRELGHIAIGQPYTLGGADPAARFESHCPVEITGFWSPDHPAIAGGTLAALLGGVHVLHTMLQHFVSLGGRVLDPDDESDIDLAALFGQLFGPVRGE